MTQNINVGDMEIKVRISDTLKPDEIMLISSQCADLLDDLDKSVAVGYISIDYAITYLKAWVKDNNSVVVIKNIKEEYCE